MNRAPVVLMSALFIACATRMPTPPAEPIRDSRIVPLVRLGPYALGMTEAQMLQWVGEADRAVGNMYLYGAWDGANKSYVRIDFSGGRAGWISTNQRQYVTADGVGVGSSLLKARANYGAPTATRDSPELGTVEMCFENGLEITLDAQTSLITFVALNYDGCSLR